MSLFAKRVATAGSVGLESQGSLVECQLGGNSCGRQGQRLEEGAESERRDEGLQTFIAVAVPMHHMEQLDLRLCVLPVPLDDLTAPEEDITIGNYRHKKTKKQRTTRVTWH